MVANKHYNTFTGPGQEPTVDDEGLGRSEPRGRKKKVGEGSVFVQKGERVSDARWYGVGDDYGLARLGMDWARAQRTQNHRQYRRNKEAQRILSELPDETKMQVLAAFVKNNAMKQAQNVAAKMPGAVGLGFNRQ
jgi:hypothetical protein